MNRHAAPTPGVFHFLQHNTVPPQAWHSFRQALTQAYQKMRAHPHTLGLATVPVICEHTGNRPLRYDDSMIGLGMIGFNGDRVAHQAGTRFYCTGVKRLMRRSGVTRGDILTSGWWWLRYYWRIPTVRTLGRLNPMYR